MRRINPFSHEMAGNSWAIWIYTVHAIRCLGRGSRRQALPRFPLKLFNDPLSQEDAIFDAFGNCDSIQALSLARF